MKYQRRIKPKKEIISQEPVESKKEPPEWGCIIPVIFI